MEQNQENDIVLVVSSCDKYKSAWKPYFTLLQIYWKTHPKSIYLISETETYFHEGLSIRICNYGINTSWSERLINTLQQIDSKYIIFTLEDFFLLGYVKQEQIDECYSWMEKILKLQVYVYGDKIQTNYIH